MLNPLAAEGRMRGSPLTLVGNARGSIPTTYCALLSLPDFQQPFHGNRMGFQKISCPYCPLTEAHSYKRDFELLLMAALRLKR